METIAGREILLATNRRALRASPADPRPRMQDATWLRACELDALIAEKLDDRLAYGLHWMAPDQARSAAFVDAVRDPSCAHGAISCRGVGFTCADPVAETPLRGLGLGLYAARRPGGIGFVLEVQPVTTRARNWLRDHDRWWKLHVKPTTFVTPLSRSAPTDRLGKADLAAALETGRDRLLELVMSSGCTLGQARPGRMPPMRRFPPALELWESLAAWTYVAGALNVVLYRALSRARAPLRRVAVERWNDGFRIWCRDRKKPLLEASHHDHLTCLHLKLPGGAPGSLDAVEAVADGWLSREDCPVFITVDRATGEATLLLDESTWRSPSLEDVVADLARTALEAG